MANRIHPTAVVGDGVVIGDGNVIGPYSVILGPCRIGDGNWIGPHVSIGAPAEWRGGPHPAAWDGELDGAGVEIGDRNVIREYVSIHQGYTNRATSIGVDCYVMTGAHIGHDTVIGDTVTITSAVQIAGHCTVWEGANLGLGTVVHQRSEIGPGAMVGMGSVVKQEIKPFSVAVGNPARTVGVNELGLTRRGCSAQSVDEIRRFVAGHIDAVESVPEDVASLLNRWTERTLQNT